MATKPLNTQQKRLILLGILSLALWVVAETRPILYPLIYLNTHIHELCHALSAWATGGAPTHIEVYASGSGVAPIRGGVIFIVAAAGYVGAAAIGGLLLASSKSADHSKKAIYTLAIFLLFSMIALVRGDLVGIVSGWLWVLLLFGFAKKASPTAQQNLVAFLGIQQCLTSTYSLLILQKLTVALETQNDAGIMQDSTGIPALFWAILWSLLGIIAMWWGLRKAASTK